MVNSRCKGKIILAEYKKKNYMILHKIKPKQKTRKGPFRRLLQVEQTEGVFSDLCQLRPKLKA